MNDSDWRMKKEYVKDDSKMKNQAVAIIRAALDITTDSVAFDERNIADLVRLFSKQSLQYVMIVGLKKLSCAYLLGDSLKRYEAKAAYDYIQRKESIRQISEALNFSGVEHIPLKGAALRSLYPDPCMRSSSDIDVLVHEKDLDSAIRIIEEKTSFVFQEKTLHNAHFLSERLHLELHFSLQSNIKQMDRVLDKAWQYSCCREDYVCDFTPEYQVFYITAHAAKHFIRGGGIGIRPLLDLWMLKTKTTYDENTVEQLCEEAGIHGYYIACMKLINVWFANDQYDEITDELESIVFSGGVFGSDHLKILAHKRKTGKSYMASRFVRPRNEIVEMYPICRNHPVLIPICQVARWTHLFNRKKRKAVREEIKHVNQLDQVEIEKYDDLLRKLGL